MPQGRAYSVDERLSRGTAHFAVDFVMDKKTAPRVANILQADATLLNEALAMTDWDYKGTRFNPYQYFIAPDNSSAEQARDAVLKIIRLADANLPVFRTKRLDI